MLKSDPWNKLARKESRLFSKQIFMKQKGELYVDKMNLFLFQMPGGRKSKIQVNDVIDSFFPSSLCDQLGHACVPRGHHSFPQALPTYSQRLGTAQFSDAHGSRHKDSRVEWKGELPLNKGAAA